MISTEKQQKKSALSLDKIDKNEHLKMKKYHYLIKKE